MLFSNAGSRFVRRPWLVGSVEHTVREPAPEVCVVAELFKQLGVVLHQPDDHRSQGLIQLDPSVLFVGVALRVLVGFVRRYPLGDFFGDELTDAITVRPVDIAEEVVEGLDDRGQPFKLRLWPVTAALQRYRIDLFVFIGKEQTLCSLLLDPVAVHVDGFENALRQILAARRGQLRDQEVQED